MIDWEYPRPQSPGETSTYSTRDGAYLLYMLTNPFSKHNACVTIFLERILRMANDDLRMNGEDVDSIDEIESYKQRLLSTSSLDEAKQVLGLILNETVRDSSKVRY
jgi:hypothetical protein